MNLSHSPKPPRRGFVRVSGCFLFCLLLLSIIGQPSSAQTSQQSQPLPFGVKVGDTFSYKILNYQFSTVPNLFPDLTHFPLTDLVANASGAYTDQFQVQITGFSDTNTQVCVTTDNGCQYFTPVVTMNFTSGNFTDPHARIYPEEFPSSLIVTTDWAFLSQQANYSGSDSPMVSSCHRFTNIRTDGPNTLVSMYLEIYYTREYSNSIQERVLTSSAIYDTKTGVLEYANSGTTEGFNRTSDGTAVFPLTMYSFEIINEAYSGSTNVPTLSGFPQDTPSVGLPLYIPVFMFIPIALVRKRLKTQ